MVRRLAVVLAFVLVAPATASAADVSVRNGVLRYVAAPNERNNVTLREPSSGTVVVDRAAEDEDELVAGDNCVPGPGDSVICSDVTRAEIDLGDESDRVTATFEPPDRGLMTIPTTVTAGDGNDAVVAGARVDTIEGGSGDDDLDGGAGNDSIRGGDGNDVLRPNTGTDAMIGGEGIDTAVYGYRDKVATYTLDGLPNDGESGENDLIGADVENVWAPADRASTLTVTITGDTRANHLRVLDGRGDVTGGEGADVLEGGPRDDVLRARDGSPDIVICGGGTDTVEADTLDTVSPSCENVSVQATPGGPFDDRPPAIAWTAPAAGASLSADATSVLAVNATDDRGVARVQFFDDDRLLCDVTEPPYTCALQPRGGDVGRNTLLAVAVDGANQTTGVVRAVTVRRFSAPSLGLSLRPGRDRRAPYAFRATGRLARPSTVSPSQGCSGTVSITAKRGRRTVTTRRTTLSPNCEYSVILRFRSRPARRLRLQARFSGNDVLARRNSRSRTIGLG